VFSGVVQIPDSIYRNVMNVTEQGCNIVIPMTKDNFNNLISKCFMYSLGNRNDLEAGRFISNLAKTMVDPYEL